MKIAIDIDNTVFTNNSIIYKLLNNVQILGDKNDTTLEFSKVSLKPIPTKGLLKKIFPFINPSKFVAYRVNSFLYRSLSVSKLCSSSNFSSLKVTPVLESV